MRNTLSLIALTISTAPAFAQCPTNQHPILSCNIEDSQKALTACHDGAVATYAFGKPGQTPELIIKTPVTQINYTPWNGVGRGIYEQVIFDNAGVGYLLWSAFEKDPGVEQPFSGGIVVQQNGEDLASLMCDPGTMEVGIDGLFEVMESHGQCWDYSDFKWIACTE